MSGTRWRDLDSATVDKLEAGAARNRAARKQRAAERRKERKELGPVSSWVTLSRVSPRTHELLLRIGRLRFGLEVVAGQDPQRWTLRDVLDCLAREELDRLEEAVRDHPELGHLLVEDV